MTALLTQRAPPERPRLARPPAILPVLILVFLVFCLAVPRFGTLGNIENVLRVAAILGIVACGQAVVIILGGIEFSFGAAAALASVTCVMALPHLGAAGAFAVAAVTVAAIGMANGFLVARFDIPSVIVTLGTLMMASGAAASLAGGMPIDAAPSEAFSWPARGRVLGIPVPILAAGAALLILHVLLARSRIGRSWYLVGANPAAARLAGLGVARVTFLGYLTASLFCALGAVILTSRVGSGQPALAPNLAFETIAACAIGGLPLSGGRGRVSQIACGVLVVAMLNNAVVLLNLAVAYQLIVMGLIVIGAVALQRDHGIAQLLSLVARGRRK